MFKYNINYVEKKEHNNLVLAKQMEVGDLHVFLILDTFEEKMADLLLNKIIDFLVENLVKKDVYNSFSNTLEKINKFLKEIKISNEDENDDKINNTSLLIGILDDKGNLFFSKTGKSSFYLVKNLNEISEITDKKSNFENFTFVSSGKLESGDLIVFSNKRLLNYLAKSDLKDIWEREDLQKSTAGVTSILQNEKTKANLSFLSIKFYGNEDIENKEGDGFISFFISKTKLFFKKPKKNIIKFYNKISFENKLLKNILLALGIFISIYILYFIVKEVIYKGSFNTIIEKTKTEISEARSYINLAIKANNSKDKSNFNINIDKAEEITKSIISKKILKDDTDKLLRDIANLKKEFNNVKIFEANEDNLVAKTDEKKVIKIIENRNKIFVIGEDKIIGPIISSKKPKRNIFNEMSKGDKFIDAISVGDNILLLTKQNRIVKFSRNKKFSYLKVIGQKKWEEAKAIKKFGSNIYLIGKNNQIYKHKFAGANSYTSGENYLTKPNILQIGEILASGIDGGIYILKNNLTLVKFFKKGDIVNTIDLKKIPNNFILGNKEGKIDILIPEKSKYVFLFLNNKIWFFKPNTKDYTNVDYLTFLGQIEAKEFNIKSFVVKGNSEILILNENGVYKINFGVKTKDDGTEDLILN